MKTDLKHWFRWLESTPWTETPLYHGRSQKPEEQAKYSAAMATKTGLSKTTYALLDWFGGLSKIHRVAVGIAVLVILFCVWTFANTALQKPSVAANLANLPPQRAIDNWKAGEDESLQRVKLNFSTNIDSRTIAKIEYGSQLESRGGKGIPVGTVLYPLRIHVTQVENAVQTSGRISPPGIRHINEDVYFYQDPFGKWLNYSAGSQIVDFIQTGPTPPPLWMAKSK